MTQQISSPEWAGLVVGVELNNREVGQWLTDFKLLVCSVHSISERISLNW